MKKIAVNLYQKLVGKIGEIDIKTDKFFEQITWKRLVLLWFLSLIVFYGSNFILEHIASRDYFSIIPALSYAIYFLFYFLLVILVVPLFRNYINDKAGLVSVILVVLTIIITFGCYYVDQLNTFYKTNTLLQATNEINYNIAFNLIKDQKDQWLYWSDFLTSPYEENISFIAKDFTSGVCINDYLDVMASMQIVNKMNDNIDENYGGYISTTTSQGLEEIAGFEALKNDIYPRAQKIESDLANISNQCS